MKKIIILSLLFANFIFGQITITTPSGRIVPKQAADKIPPVINITEPAIQNLNLVTVKNKKLKLIGNVLDDSKVLSFSVNKKEVRLDGSNNFEDEVELKPGNNTIDFKAIDEYKNVGQYNIKVFFQSDRSAPLITITEPKIIEGVEFIHKEVYLTIRGKVSDESGVRDVFINNDKVTILPSNEFYAIVKLIEGINTLIVKATDSTSNIGEKLIKVTYQSDNDGPIIAILEPFVSRGSTVVSKKEIQTLKGIATDKSGVFEVMVNKRKTVLNSNGEFTLDLYLSVGDNQIIVNSADTKMNV